MSISLLRLLTDNEINDVESIEVQKQVKITYDTESTRYDVPYYLKIDQEYVKKLYDAGIDEGICQEYLRWFWRVYGYEIDFEEYLEMKEKTYW